MIAEAKRYPGQEQMVLSYYMKNKEAIENLRAPAFEEKIVDYVLGKAKIENNEVSVEELYDFSDASDKAAKKPAKAKTTKAKKSA
jgi:trigger factor